MSVFDFLFAWHGVRMLEYLYVCTSAFGHFCISLCLFSADGGINHGMSACLPLALALGARSDEGNAFGWLFSGCACQGGAVVV